MDGCLPSRKPRPLSVRGETGLYRLRVLVLDTALALVLDEAASISGIALPTKVAPTAGGGAGGVPATGSEDGEEEHRGYEETGERSPHKGKGLGS